MSALNRIIEVPWHKRDIGEEITLHLIDANRLGVWSTGEHSMAIRGKEKIEQYVKQLEFILPIMKNLVEHYKRIAASLDIPVITIKLIDNGIVIEHGQMSRRTITFDNPQFITVKLFKESKEDE